MRILLIIIIIFCIQPAQGQVPLYEFRDIKKTLTVPNSINSERSLVIVHVPDNVEVYRKTGNWKKLAQQSHKAFVTMGVDAVIYINHYDLIASKKSEVVYSELFSKRNIKNIIFLTQSKDYHEIAILPFNERPTLIDNNLEAFFIRETGLYDILLKTGKEIRRADFDVDNFLIPEKPSFIEGISVIEKTQLQNYPGILRRTKLAVEKFAPLSIPKDATDETQQRIEAYNQQIVAKNEELDSLMKSYPYEYEIIDPMSDDDLVRKRYQFVLRSISGQAKTLRQMLDYAVDRSETDFISTVPVMPDQTRAKPIPKNALVHKFYVRQNISKNVHVGVWDADVTWQEALINMIGNLIQEHKVDTR